MYTHTQLREKYAELAEYADRYHRLGLKPSDKLNLRLRNLMNLSKRRINSQ